MINSTKSIVMDIDGTLCPIKKDNQKYDDLKPFPTILNKLKEYRDSGFYIILYTARNMRTYEGNIGRIMANTSKQVLKWLDEHGVPYDEIYFGKPWPGHGGFYVDDRSIRPSEFLDLTYDEICEITNQ